MDNTRPVRTNTADRAPNTLVTQRYVRILVCTVSFQGNIHTNPAYIPVHIELQQQITVPVDTSKNDKITSCLASDGQHAPARINTAKHVPHMATHYRHVPVQIISFLQIPAILQILSFSTQQQCFSLPHQFSCFLLRPFLALFNVSVGMSLIPLFFS